VNRSKNRIPLAVIAVLGLAALLSGCGAGQVSQTALQDPAINGNKVTIQNVALRNIRIQAVQRGDFLQPGRTVDLALVAVNESPDTTDNLVGITSEIGTVTVSGDTRIPAGGMLFIGEPEGKYVAPGPIDSNTAARATITLAKPITNGLNYHFTFKFEKAGQASVLVPISAPVTSPEV